MPKGATRGLKGDDCCLLCSPHKPAKAPQPRLGMNDSCCLKCCASSPAKGRVALGGRAVVVRGASFEPKHAHSSKQAHGKRSAQATRTRTTTSTRAAAATKTTTTTRKGHQSTTHHYSHGKHEVHRFGGAIGGDVDAAVRFHQKHWGAAGAAGGKATKAKAYHSSKTAKAATSSKHKSSSYYKTSGPGVGAGTRVVKSRDYHPGQVVGGGRLYKTKSGWRLEQESGHWGDAMEQVYAGDSAEYSISKEAGRRISKDLRGLELVRPKLVGNEDIVEMHGRHADRRDAVEYTRGGWDSNSDLLRTMATHAEEGAEVQVTTHRSFESAEERYVHVTPRAIVEEERRGRVERDRKVVERMVSSLDIQGRELAIAGQVIRDDGRVWREFKKAQEQAEALRKELQAEYKATSAQESNGRAKGKVGAKKARGSKRGSQPIGSRTAERAQARLEASKAAEGNAGAHEGERKSAPRESGGDTTAYCHTMSSAARVVTGDRKPVPASTAWNVERRVAPTVGRTPTYNDAFATESEARAGPAVPVAVQPPPAPTQPRCSRKSRKSRQSCSGGGAGCQPVCEPCVPCSGVTLTVGKPTISYGRVTMVESSANVGPAMTVCPPPAPVPTTVCNPCMPVDCTAGLSYNCCKPAGFQQERSCCGGAPGGFVGGCGPRGSMCGGSGGRGGVAVSSATSVQPINSLEKLNFLKHRHKHGIDGY